MNVVPLGGLIGSATGSPVAQTKESEVEREKRESDAQTRKVDLVGRSEQAQGLRQTKEDYQISERDANGHRPRETTLHTHEEQKMSVIHDPLQSRDVAATSHNQLDVTG